LETAAALQQNVGLKVGVAALAGRSQELPTALIGTVLAYLCCRWVIEEIQTQGALPMSLILLAAAEYSILYLLLGGGFGGAILIYIIARALGK
jgi:hypothetical protein